MSHHLGKKGFTPRMPQVLRRRAEVAHLRSAGTIMAKRLVKELKEKDPLALAIASNQKILMLKTIKIK